MSLQKAQELGASSVADGSIWKPLEVEAQLEAAGPGEPVIPSELCPVLGQILLTLPSASSVQSPSILRPPPSFLSSIPPSSLSLSASRRCEVNPLFYSHVFVFCFFLTKAQK